MLARSPFMVLQSADTNPFAQHTGRYPVLQQHTDHALLRRRGPLKPVPRVLAMPGLGLAVPWRGRARPKD